MKDKMVAEGWDRIYAHLKTVLVVTKKVTKTHCSGPCGKPFELSFDVDTSDKDCRSELGNALQRKKWCAHPQFAEKIYCPDCHPEKTAIS